MSNTIRNNVIASFCFFAVLFAAAVGVVDAQSQTPIDDEDILACVTMGDEVWAAPVALKPALESATGQNATVETTRQLLDRLPQASSSNGVRFEGGNPSQAVRQDLKSLGYDVIAPTQPQVPGAQHAYSATL